MFIFVRFNEDNVKRLNFMKINIVKNRLLVTKNLSLNIFPSALKKNVCVKIILTLIFTKRLEKTKNASHVLIVKQSI